ncbi:MAG: phage tail tube protein [Mycobacterium sp.]
MVTATATSAVTLRYKPESSFGTAAAGNWQPLRFTGEQLASNVTVVESEVIRNDAAIDNFYLTDADGGGSVGGELGYGDWELLMAAAIMAPGVTANSSTVSTADTISLVAPSSITTTYTAGGLLATGGINFGSLGFAAGDWVTLSGFDNDIHTTHPNPEAFNGSWLVVALATTSTTNDTMHLAGLVGTVSAVGGTNIRVVKMDEARSSNVVNTYQFEKEKNGDFQLYSGVGVNGFSLDVTPNGMITVSTDLTTKTPENNTSSAASGNNTEATGASLSSNTGFDRFYEGSTPDIGTASQTSIDWLSNPSVVSAAVQFNPNLRIRKAAGTVGVAIKHGAGTLAATGSITAYYGFPSSRDPQDLLNKSVNNTSTHIVLAMTDGVGGSWVFDMPNCKITAARDLTQGKDQDVVIEFEFAAYIQTDYPTSGVDFTVRQLSSAPA